MFIRKINWVKKYVVSEKNLGQTTLGSKRFFGIKMRVEMAEIWAKVTSHGNPGRRAGD